MKKNKASPNLENGWTGLPNELWEALMRVNMGSQEERILRVVIRETYGWRVKEKAISLIRFSELAGISKPHVCHTLKKLQKRRIVVRNKNKFGLQEDYLCWKGYQKPPKRAKKTITQIGNAKKTIAQVGNVAQVGNAPPLPNQATKLPREAIDVAQVGNANQELANVHKLNSPSKEIKETIKERVLTATAKILLIFRGKTTPKKILKAIKDKDPDEMIALAKDCQEKEEKDLTKNAPRLFFKQAKKSAKVPSTENKPKVLSEGTAMKKGGLPHVYSITPDSIIELFRKKGLKEQELEDKLWEVNNRYKDQTCHLSINFDVPKEKLSRGETTRMVAIAKEMAK